jgi:hypothetical protein
MTLTRKLGIAALMFYTLAVTVLRAFRSPNDFAEAHWLLDYRFGFVKRGLIGEILSLITGSISLPITAQVISTLAVVTFLIYCAALTILSIRIVQKSGWSTGAVLVSIVFLSSPFVVMSAHLIGYYDNIVIVLGILSVVLLLKGRPWFGAWLQVLALLTHENSLLIVFPPFCLAWLLMNSRYQRSGVPILPLLPLLLPIYAFLAMAVSQQLFLAKNFVELFTARLSQFPFIQNNRSTLVPVWISASFLDYYAAESGAFFLRLSSVNMYGLVLPSALAILLFAVNVYQILDLSAESIIVLAVFFVPQTMHLVAWDTPRIWTYTILSTFFALWIYSEIFTAHKDSSASRLLCLVALVTNVVSLTPLMDKQTDHYSLNTRLLFYTPVFIGSLAFIFYRESISVAERLSIKGCHISKLLKQTKRLSTDITKHSD